MSDTADIVRRLFDHLTRTGVLTDQDWRAFKEQNPMPAAQAEPVLLATLQHVLTLANEQQLEMQRLSHALARRG